MIWAPAWTRPVDGPATHALVIGVSTYPEAKPGLGYEQKLRNVRDIASADASAMLVADWLYRNRDAMVPRLGSIDLLHGSSAAPAGGNQYALQAMPPPAEVHAADSATVKAAGKEWVKRLRSTDGNAAFFFICGHGAIRNGQHVVFLSDLNADEDHPWGAHLNLFKLGDALRHENLLTGALLYADSCQEFITDFELEEDPGEVVLIRAPKKIVGGTDKVLLLSAAAGTYKAYEGTWRSDPTIKVGRFTETLVDALSTSVRFNHQGGDWMVHSHSVQEDLVLLHRIRRPDWRAIAFDPSASLWPSRILPIARIDHPTVPIVVQTEPVDRMASCALSIYLDTLRTPPPYTTRGPGDANDWVPELEASMGPHVLEAQAGGAVGQVVFYPQAPQVVQRVKVP